MKAGHRKWWRECWEESKFYLQKNICQKVLYKRHAWETLSFLAQPSPRSCKDPEKMYKEAQRLKSEAEFH